MPMRCVPLHACHLPCGDGILQHDGAVMIELLLLDVTGDPLAPIHQEFDPWAQRLMEPFVRLPDKQRIVGLYQDEGLRISTQEASFCLGGVIRNYRRDLPLVTPWGRFALVLSTEVPGHLRELFAWYNSVDLADWDDD